MSYAYSVAIKLTLANLASQGLKLLTGDLLAATGAAGKLEGKLKALKLVAVGYGLEKIGSSTLGFLEKSINASKEYTHQLSLMNAAGMSQREIALSTAAAWKTSRDVLTTTAADNLKAIRELRSVFGVSRMDEAYSILPTVQRTRGILEALTGKPQENVAFDMVKAIEMRTPGVMSKESMQRNADLMSRTLMAFGGTLNTNDMHMAMKQLKTMAFGFNDEFVYSYLPTFIQEAKTKGGSGSSAATALRTLSNAMIGGVGLNKASIPVWTEMGWIKQSDVVRNATGQFGLRPHAVKDLDLYQANPEAWAQKHASEVAQYGSKHHISLLETVMALFKNTNAQWAMYTLLAKAPQFERDKKLVESGGNSIQTYQRLMKTNPQLAEQAMHAQWQNVLSILGYQILPRLIPYMVKFANFLDGISQWMVKHQTLTQVLVVGLGGIGLAFSLIGKALMMAGMIRFLGIGPVILAALTPLGLAVAAIAAIGVAGYELYKHWSWVKEQLGIEEEWKGSAGHRAHDGKPSDVWSGSGGHRQRSSVAPMTQVHTTINLDGRKIASVVTEHQARELSKPNGGANFDGTLTLAPVSLNQGH